MLEAYRTHVAEREELGVPPKPLDAAWTSELVELLQDPPKGEEDFLLDLLTNRIPPGVDEAAYVKAGFLSAIVKDEASSPIVDKPLAVELLGNMLGGYNVSTLIDLLDDQDLAEKAADQLKKITLVFDAFYDISAKADQGNSLAKAIIQSWADAEWFNSKDPVASEIKAVVFKVSGETIQMTFPRHKTPGPGQTYLFMQKPCTRCKGRVSSLRNQELSGPWDR